MEWVQYIKERMGAGSARYILEETKPAGRGLSIHNPELYFYSEHLLPNHFVKRDNGYVYTAIGNLAKQGIKTVDPYNILECLESTEGTRGYAKELSIDKLNELMDMSDILARSSVEEYKMLVANVMDAAFRRDTFQKLRDCQALCYNRSEENVERKIYDIIDDIMTEYSTVDEIPKFCDVVDELWEDIEKHQDGNESGIPFKFPTLNEYVRIESGELVVVGAPAKGAKSMFMLNEAVDILRRGKSVMYIDSELSSRLFLCRLVSHLTGIEFNRIRSGRYDDEEAARIKEQIAWVKQQKLVHMYGLGQMRYFGDTGVLEWRAEGEPVYHEQATSSNMYEAVGRNLYH